MSHELLTKERRAEAEALDALYTDLLAQRDRLRAEFRIADEELSAVSLTLKLLAVGAGAKELG